MKAIVIYYSYGGNTDRVAQIIRQETDADAVRIETVQPYTGTYETVVDQGRREVCSGFCPEIKPLNVDLSVYDTVILGSPVWWYTFAPAMHSFLQQADFTGKTVWPFATNGGWIGHTFEDFETSCCGASLRKGLNVRFDESALRTPEANIRRWAKDIG